MKISFKLCLGVQTVAVVSAFAALASAQSGVRHNWDVEAGARGAEQGARDADMGYCPPLSVVNGIRYFEHFTGENPDWVNRIGVSCINLLTGKVTEHDWDPSGEPSRGQGTHGMGGGKCPAGHVVNGVQYYEGGKSDWVDAIGISCLRLSDGETLFVNWHRGREPRGAEHGTHGRGMGVCPPGMVVGGVRYFLGERSDWVDGLGIFCVEPPGLLSPVEEPETA
ncbi:hypothetical protein [Polyangium spumosum]|uniref:Uncharacterized protein n=1 Tax=Polyangium spumosum TaxID=889282 RepID=A0A6N7PLM3_9BACT|nr:hypothetical protein [Polyangium spumosum]MRG93042.1 hypothetical protein [Polyangium spumosum]